MSPSTMTCFERLRGMDDPSLVDKLYEIGCIAAEKQVKPEHLFN